MEVKIGIQNSARELTINVDGSADDLAASVSSAVETATGVLTLTDTKGRTLLVPVASLAYVEMGAGVEGKVGFRSS